MMRVEMHGVDELEQAMKRAPVKMRSELKRVVGRGTQRIYSRARAHVRVRTGKTRGRIYFRTGAGRVVLEGQVGNTRYVARWLEFGTKERKTRRGGWRRGRMQARPFLYPALRAEKARILAEVQAAVNRVVRGF